MIEITLQFKTAEEAIVALAKMSGGAAAKAAAGEVNPSAVNPVTPATAAASRGRKPRADAGQPRGPNVRTAQSNVEQKGNIVGESRSTLESASNGSAAIAPSVDPVSPSASAPEPAAPAPAEADKAQPSGPAPDAAGPAAETTAEAAELALTKLFETKGLAIAQATLGAFGVKRLKELPAEKRGEFVAAATKALA